MYKWAIHSADRGDHTNGCKEYMLILLSIYIYVQATGSSAKWLLVEGMLTWQHLSCHVTTGKANLHSSLPTLHHDIGPTPRHMIKQPYA